MPEMPRIEPLTRSLVIEMVPRTIPPATAAAAELAVNAGERASNARGGVEWSMIAVIRKELLTEAIQWKV